MEFPVGFGKYCPKTNLKNSMWHVCILCVSSTFCFIRCRFIPLCLSRDDQLFEYDVLLHVWYTGGRKYL